MSEEKTIHDIFHDQVIQVNNMIPMDRHNKKERYVMTHDTYPEQNKICVGKFIRIKYTDEREQGIIHYRFWIPNFDKEQGLPGKFLILRWDCIYPYRVILMNSAGIVIVTTDSKMQGLTFPKDYTADDHKVDFPRRKELLYGLEVDDETLNKNLLSEYIHQYPIQDYRYFGAKVYTEYLDDITDTSITNQLEGTKFKNWRDYRFQKDNNEKWDHKPDTIYEELMAGDKKNGLKKPYRLRGFSSFFDRHKQDMVDTPRKAYNHGFIIRADKDSDRGVIVVAETSFNTVRFVTDKEAYFYTKTSWIQPQVLKTQREVKQKILEYKIEGEE